MKPDTDRRVIACNWARATSAVAEGAKAYVLLTNPGNGHDRLNVLVRSRKGRWIETWRSRRDLEDFRAVTIPPEHGLYDRLEYADHGTQADELADTIATAAA